MAHLSNQEKVQLQEAAGRTTPRPPRPPTLSPKDLLAFLTFASQFKPAPKAVRFIGEHWKL